MLLLFMKDAVRKTYVLKKWSSKEKILLNFWQKPIWCLSAQLHCKLWVFVKLNVSYPSLIWKKWWEYYMTEFILFKKKSLKKRSTAFRVGKSISFKLCPWIYLGPKVIEMALVFGNISKWNFWDENRSSARRPIFCIDE